MILPIYSYNLVFLPSNSTTIMLRNIAITTFLKTIIIFVLSLIEIYLFSLGKQTFGFYTNPILMTIAGLVMAVILLLPTKETTQNSLSTSVAIRIGIVVLWLIGIFYIGQRIQAEFKAYPIDHKESDVLAQVLTPSQILYVMNEEEIFVMEF